MALKIIWTSQALSGYEKIVNYLEQNWSDREVSNFVEEADRFFETLAIHPEILPQTGRRKNTHRGPINRLTIVTYRVKPRSKQIELINIRGARQKPLKRYPPF